MPEVKHRRVEEVMQKEVVTLEKGERLDLVEDIMHVGRVRHMPVVDGGKLVGMISQRDLLASSLSKTLDFDAQERRTFLRSVDAAEAMTSDLVTVLPAATLAEAAAVMLRHKIGCLPVVDEGGALLGILTETDLVRVTLLGDESDEPLENKDREENVMSDVRERIDEELDGLRQARDELKVQVHLAKAEAQDLWEQLEDKYERVENHAKQIARDAEQPLHDVADAAKLLIEEIREGYKQIRAAL